MKFDLVFLVDTVIPSKRASCVHVEKLYEAFRKTGLKVGLLSQTNDLSYQGIDDGHHLVVSTYAGKGKLLLLIWRYIKKLKGLNASVIYSRFVLLSYFISKTPFVLELHADSWNKTALNKFLFPRLLRKPNLLGIVAITRAIKADLQVAFPGYDKPVTIIEDAASMPPGRYTPVFRETERLNIGYVGSFHKGKGVDLILLIAATMPQHDFTIVGGSEQEIQKLKKNGVSSNVIFKGFVRHNNLWKEMEDIDVCLLPNQLEVKTGKKSDIGKYTSPLKMFEYMSYSKPIVASDLEVLREVLTDDISLFAGHDSVKEWTEAINRFCTVENRKTYGKRAFKYFSENCTWEKRAKRVLLTMNLPLSQ